VRPFGLAFHRLDAGPREAFAPDAAAVADRFAAAEHEIKIGVRRIDDDRSGRFRRRIIDNLTPQPRARVRCQTAPRPICLAGGLGSLNANIWACVVSARNAPANSKAATLMTRTAPNLIGPVS